MRGAYGGDEESGMSWTAGRVRIRVAFTCVASRPLGFSHESAVRGRDEAVALDRSLCLWRQVRGRPTEALEWVPYHKGSGTSRLCRGLQFAIPAMKSPGSRGSTPTENVVVSRPSQLLDHSDD